MKYIQTLTEKGKLKWHNSDAPEADGKFRDLSPKDLAAWLIKTRKGDMKRISGSLSQQVAFNQNDDKEYVKKMDKTRKEVYKQLDREDLLDKIDESLQEPLYNSFSLLQFQKWVYKNRAKINRMSKDEKIKYLEDNYIKNHGKTHLGSEDLKGVGSDIYHSMVLHNIIKESVLNEEDTWNDYPAAAKKNAQKAIDWKEKYGRDEVDAGTPVGWARAHQLAKGENLSTDTVKRMSAFNRHRKNSSIKPELKETPWKDRGYVAWLIWGGDEGVDWAIEKSKEIDAMKESKQMKYIKPLNEAEKYITDEFKVGDKIKTNFGEWEVIETDYAPNKSFTAPFIFKGKDMERVNIPNPPKTNKKAVGYKVTDGDKYPIIGFLYQYKDITKLATVGVDESVVNEKDKHTSTDFSKPGNDGDIYFSKREGDAVGIRLEDKLQMIYVFQEEPKLGRIQKTDKRWENMGPASEELLIDLRGRTEGKILFDFVSTLEESVVNEEKIKYAKGKTYQSSGHWTVYVDSNSSGFDIRVNHSAGWRLDPHDEKEETLELLDNGRQRATIYFKSGNIDKFAQKMFDLNDRTSSGNQTKLTAKDYADIIRVWIDMKMANESIKEAKLSKVHKAAKQGSYPAVIVVVQDGKVIHQEPVSTPQVAPATFNVMQEKYPKALLHLEDKTGKRLFSESLKSFDNFVAEINEARAYKLKASEFGADTHSAAYNVKGETTWRVHSTYAIDQVSGENNPEERDVVFFEAMPINNDIYIKIGGINNLKRTNGSTVGNNFGTTIEEWKNNPRGIAKEASDFLTDATHLKWINKKARSEGQVIKWALKDDYSSVIEDLVNKSLGLSESVVSDDKLMNLIPKMPKGYVGKNTGTGEYTISTPDGEDIVLTQSRDKKKWSYEPSNIALKVLEESQVTEKREDVGKYNTVKKVIAKIGRRPSEQELATFITKNYYDVTEVERGDDDPAANDKIADLVAFYKYDIDDWNIAWVDAQNESAKTFKHVKPLNEYFGKYEYGKFTKEFGKIKYPKYVKVKMKELVAGGFLDKIYDNESNYMSFWLNQMGDRKFDTDERKKELGEVGYKLTDMYWHDLTGSTAFMLQGAEAAYEISKHVEDLVANKEDVEPAYYLMKEYFINYNMQVDRSRIFKIAVEKLEKWMEDNAIETL